MLWYSTNEFLLSGPKRRIFILTSLLGLQSQAGGYTIAPSQKGTDVTPRSQAPCDRMGVVQKVQLPLVKFLSRLLSALVSHPGTGQEQVVALAASCPHPRELPEWIPATNPHTHTLPPQFHLDVLDQEWRRGHLARCQTQGRWAQGAVTPPSLLGGSQMYGAMWSCKGLPGQCRSFPGWGESRSQIAGRKPRWRGGSGTGGNSWGPHTTFSKEAEESLFLIPFPPAPSSRGCFSPTYPIPTAQITMS